MTPVRRKPRDNSSKSATPGPNTTRIAPKSKVKFNSKASTAGSNPTSTAQYGEHDNDTNEPLQHIPRPFTTRTGRTVNKRQYFDDVQGSEYERMINQSSDRVDEVYSPSDPCKSNRLRKFRSIRKLTSPPAYDSHRAKSSQVSQQQQQQSESRASRRPKTQPSRNNTPLPKIDEEEFPQSNIAQVPATAQVPAIYEPETQEAYQILNALRHSASIHLDLPGLSNVNNPEQAQPYSAKDLTEIYILSYQQSAWDVCDVVADTWIRAFHELRAQDQRDPTNPTWRANKALLERKRKSKEAWNKGMYMASEFDPNPKDYGLTVADPELDSDVTAVNFDLLNTLYKHTDRKCGARMLWADALALRGDKTETIMETAAERGAGLHTDLVFNVMQTSLRMLRRNLTLKIEESTEGAWCKRYHEHTKHGLPCYREKAWRHASAVDGGVIDDDDEVDNEEPKAYGGAENLVDGEGMDEFEAQMLREMEEAYGVKRGFDGDGEVSGAKRTRRDEGEGDGSESECE